jgi:hypothetical protein
MTTPWEPAVVAAVAQHMNGDHAADNLLIVRELGGVPEAETAVMTGMDAEGLEFATTGAHGATRTVRVAWLTVPTDRPQVRAEVVALHAAAAARAGIVLTPQGEH